jgi:hypothetical protein
MTSRKSPTLFNEQKLLKEPKLTLFIIIVNETERNLPTMTQKIIYYRSILWHSVHNLKILLWERYNMSYQMSPKTFMTPKYPGREVEIIKVVAAIKLILFS